MDTNKENALMQGLENQAFYGNARVMARIQPAEKTFKHDKVSAKDFDIIEKVGLEAVYDMYE